MERTFKVSRTYAECTPESAEHGDFSDTGFVWQDRQLTFEECVTELQDCSELSEIPVRSVADCHRGLWASTDFVTEDYSTGTERQESVHIDAPADVLFEMFKAAKLI